MADPTVVVRRKLTREDLLSLLRSLKTSRDPEQAHLHADVALLDYLDDVEITDAYNDVPAWYA